MIAPTVGSSPAVLLTPGRTRNIVQDMEALRLSRQDNPFLQVGKPVIPYVRSCLNAGNTLPVLSLFHLCNLCFLPVIKNVLSIKIKWFKVEEKKVVALS